MNHQSTADNNLFYKTPWGDYNRYRPAYPQSMWDTIFTYHEQKSGSFKAAHDVGAGAGQAAAVLGRRFEQVYVSDPGPQNIDDAREILNSEQYLGSLPQPCSFSFAVRAGETAPETGGDWLQPGSLDMITACECMHWMDMPPAVSAFAKSLRPGGTLALAFYDAKPYVDNPKVDQALKNAYKVFFAHSLTLAPPRMQELISRSGSGVDFVDLTGPEWRKGVLRTYINFKDDEDAGRKFFGQNWMSGPNADLFVKDTDCIERIEREDDWSKTVDRSWFGGYLKSLDPSNRFGFTSDPGGKVAMQDLLDAVGDEKVKVSWLVEIVLATRT